MKLLGPILALALLATDSPPPYIRNHAIRDNPNSHCLYWPASEIHFQLNARGNGTTNDGTELDAVRRAWASWQANLNGVSNLTVVEGDLTSDVTIGRDSNGPNTNVIVFRKRACTVVVPSTDPCWSEGAGECSSQYDCFPKSDSPNSTTIALTTTTFDVNSGRIYDADLEFNAYDPSTNPEGLPFTAGDGPKCPLGGPYQGCVAYDIQATATHEIGHFLGLDHDNQFTDVNKVHSVMASTAGPGETDKRNIDLGSLKFLQDVYPKGQASRDCQSSGGCSATGKGEPFLLTAGIFAFWFYARRRRSTNVRAVRPGHSR